MVPVVIFIVGDLEEEAKEKREEVRVCAVHAIIDRSTRDKKRNKDCPDTARCHATVTAAVYSNSLCCCCVAT